MNICVECKFMKMSSNSHFNRSQRLEFSRCTHGDSQVTDEVTGEITYRYCRTERGAFGIATTCGPDGRNFQAIEKVDEAPVVSEGTPVPKGILSRLHAWFTA